METESDMHEIKKNIGTGITRGKNTRIKRKRLQLLKVNMILSKYLINNK